MERTESLEKKKENKKLLWKRGRGLNIPAKKRVPSLRLGEAGDQGGRRGIFIFQS